MLRFMYTMGRLEEILQVLSAQCSNQLLIAESVMICSKVALGINGGEVAQWPGLCIEWMKNQGLLTSAAGKKVLR